MNLDEWKFVPEERRRELITKLTTSLRGDDWYSQYVDIAEAAARELRQQLINYPEVTNVYFSDFKYVGEGADKRPIEFALTVATGLPEFTILDYVPLTFAGFVVRQMHLGDQRAEYVRTCQKLCQELKGWSEDFTLAKIREWGWEDELTGRLLTPIYDWGPSRKLIEKIYESEMTDLNKSHRLNFFFEVRKIIEHASDDNPVYMERHPDRVLSYDWNYTKNKINSIINKYNELKLKY